MLTRKSNWDTELAKFLLSRLKVPFEPGVNDCTLFALDAILAITGTDLGSELRGKYSNEDEAIALTQRLTGKEDGRLSYLAYITTTYEVPEISLKMARRGDCVVITSEDGSFSLGIISTDGIHAFFMDTNGIERVKVLDCDKAWRIGK